MPTGHLYVFFGQMSIKVSCPSFSWVVCFSVVELYELLYILVIKPLSVASFANIFSHSVGCLFFYIIITFCGFLCCVKACRFD